MLIYNRGDMYMKKQNSKYLLIEKAFLTKKVNFNEIEKLKLDNDEFTELLDYFLNNDIEIIIDNELKITNEEEIDSSDSLKLFINEISLYKRLTREEEGFLLRSYKNGDEKARQKLIESNMRLVVYIAKLFYKKSKIYVELLDLIQEGSEGLIEGIEKFDISRKNRFSTYVSWWISQKIRAYTAANIKGLIKLPRKKREVLYKIRVFVTSYFTEKGIYPSDEEISEATGIEKGQIDGLLSNDFVINSLDVTIDEKEKKLIEMITSEEQEYEYIDNKVDAEMLVKQLMQILTEREYNVILLRNGFINEKKYTLEKIGNIYGLSRERIRQIEKSAYKKIKANFNNEKVKRKNKKKK